LALSLSLLVPLQIVPSFRMVFIRARNEDVVADDFSVSFENGREFPNPSDSNLFENIDAFGVLFGPSHGTSLNWGGHYCGFEIRSNGGRMDTRADTKAGK